MTIIRTIAIASFAALTMFAQPGPAGSTASAGCGPQVEMRDPVLRAMFAELDRTRSADFVQVCAMANKVVTGNGAMTIDPLQIAGALPMVAAR